MGYLPDDVWSNICRRGRERGWDQHDIGAPLDLFFCQKSVASAHRRIFCKDMRQLVTAESCFPDRPAYLAIEAAEGVERVAPYIALYRAELARIKSA